MSIDSKIQKVLYDPLFQIEDAARQTIEEVCASHTNIFYIEALEAVQVNLKIT